MARKKRQERDRAAVFEAILGDLGDAAEVEPSATVALGALRFNPNQPRKNFDPVALEDLAHSIREKGVLEPIIVRRAGDGYEVVAGERRARAAQLAGLAEVPAIVVDLDDREALEIAITENLQREDLNAVEETEAVLGLLELTLSLDREGVVGLLHALYAEERGRVSGRKIEPQERTEAQALFRRVGRFGVSSFVSNRLPILDFPTELLDAVRNGQVEFTKAQAIARVDDDAQRHALLAQAIEENLSLSQIRRRITELRQGADTAGSHSVMAGGEGGVAEETERLVGRTKRLLNKRKLASLDRERSSRLHELLEELKRLLTE